MGTDLLQTLKIVSKFGVNTVGENLRVFAIYNILLSIEEPCGDFELGGVLNDGNEAFEFIRVELASARRS